MAPQGEAAKRCFARDLTKPEKRSPAAAPPRWWPGACVKPPQPSPESSLTRNEPKAKREAAAKVQNRKRTSHKHATQSLGAGRSTIFRSRGLQLVGNFYPSHNKMELRTQSGKSENSNRNLEIQRTFGLPCFSKVSDFIKITRYCLTFKNHSSRCQSSILLWLG